MAYSFMTIGKIKSTKEMTNKYIHNQRIEKYRGKDIVFDHVDKAKIQDNDQLIPLRTDSKGKEMSYSDAFDDRIKDLDLKIRKNAVLGYEVVMTYSPGADIDIDAWERLSMDWLRDTFDVAADGQSNILHAVCHKDEAGSPHIHAIIVPIDPNGSLNASYFTDGTFKLRQMQSDYAQSVSSLGLERGVAGSSAKHQLISKLYTQLNHAVEIPDVL